jgi:hypothetical protein
MKPSKMLTPPQAVKVAALKEASPSFVIMRRLAMRFRGILRGNDPDKLNQWLDDAQSSRVSSYWLRVFPTEDTYLQALVIANLLLLPPDPV